MSVFVLVPIYIIVPGLFLFPFPVLVPVPIPVPIPDSGFRLFQMPGKIYALTWRRVQELLTTRPLPLLMSGSGVGRPDMVAITQHTTCTHACKTLRSDYWIFTLKNNNT